MKMLKRFVWWAVAALFTFTNSPFGREYNAIHGTHTC